MWSFLINRFRFSALLIVGIVLMGFVSLFTLPLESAPEVKIPYASVTTYFPGASPLDVEGLVTEMLEDKILNLEDIKGVDSFSAEGFSSIFVEFETDANISDSVSTLQDAVNSAESQLPDGAEDPVVMELNYSNLPIFILSVSADLPHSELVDVAETVQSEILKIKNVSDVTLMGVRPKELTLEIDPTKLEHYQVSILEVLTALQGAEVNYPLGSVESDNMPYSIRFTAELEPEDFENLIIRYVGDVPIYLRDLGEVRYKIAEESVYSRTSYEGSSPESALSLYVFKKTGGDIINMVDEINERLAEMEDGVLKDVTVFTSVDYAKYIRDQLGSLSTSGFQTIILVALVLFLAIGLREALIAGLAIPLTFLISFTGLSIFGYTLNFLTLFSLILALGILVDTGIVITEGMHTRLREGSDPKDVALKTVKEYKWPLITGTLTTVAAFSPMLLMTGMIGEFIKGIPMTVSITLLASLFVGLGLLPVIGSKLLKANRHRRKSWFERKIDSVKTSYKAFLRWVLKMKKRQNRLLATLFLIFVMSIMLPISGALEVAMFAESDYPLMFIEVELPKGSSLEETNEVVEEIENALLATPEVQSFVVTVGSSANTADEISAIAVESSNLANFSITLYDETERGSLEIIAGYRELFSEIPNATIDVISVTDGPPSATPIDFQIMGPDLDELKNIGDEATDLLKQIPGAVNINSSLEESISEYVLSVDRQRAASAGLSPVTLAQLARISMNGMTVMSLETDGDDVDVILKTSSDTDINEIMALPIVTTGGSFPLSYFVDLDLSPAPSAILHINGDRTVQITAEVEAGYLPTKVLADFQDKFDPDLSSDYSINYGGAYEEITESFSSLGRAMIFGILMILVILVLQFNSFKQGFIILMTIPLALIGVFFGLALLGFQFSFPSFIGIVALSGIVVNNAIILIDRINKNKKEGMEQSEAILSAGHARFQPILLTSITTIVGILPLSLSDPTWGPLGFTIISGLVFSTALTLIVVPTLYQRFCKST